MIDEMVPIANLDKVSLMRGVAQRVGVISNVPIIYLFS